MIQRIVLGASGLPERFVSLQRWSMNSRTAPGPMSPSGVCRKYGTSQASMMLR
jgi:hypothetical protein